MKKVCISLLLMLLAFAPAWAQFSVKGTVKSQPGETAPYATVALMAARDSSLVKGAITDEAGVFGLENLSAGTYRVQVQYVGSSPKWSQPFALNETTPRVDLGTMLLEERVKSLTEITVKGQHSLIEQQGDRMVLNVNKSVIAKGNKVNDLLKYAPLVRLTSDGIRVANKGNVLILVDGRQTGQGALTAFLQNYSAEDVLKIEVLTNPPAKYDASFGAVINIMTRKSLETGVNGRVALNHSQGQQGRFTPDGSLNVRTRQWNLFTSGSGIISNLYSNQGLERQFSGSSLGNAVTTLDQSRGFSSFNGIDFTPNANHSLGMRLNGSWNRKTGNTQTITSFQGAASELDSLLQVTNRARDRSQTYDLNLYYTGKLDSNGRELSVNLTRSFFLKSSVQDLTYQRQNLENQPSGDPARLRIINPNDQKSLIAQADLNLPVRRGQWAVGVKYVAIGNDNELRQDQYRSGQYAPDSAFSSAGIYREHTYAGYGSFGASLKKIGAIKAGLRIERTDQALSNSDVRRIYTGLFPSLALNHDFRNKTSLSASYSRKIARPSLYSLVPFRTVVDPYSMVEGNPALKPAFANTLDLSYSLGQLALFANYTHTTDGIADVLFADPTTKVYIQTMGNLARVNDAYVGVSWHQELTKWWQTNSTFMLLGTQTRSQIADVPGVSLNGHGVTLSSTNILTLPGGFKTEVFLNYSSPNRYTIWKTRSLYWASVSVNKAVFKSAHLRVAFEDIFRTQINRVHVGYGPVDIQSRAYGDTQRIRVSFSYNFGKKTVKGARYKNLGNDAEKGRMGGL